MFSLEQYRALHEGAGLANRADRGQLSFAGADRRAFLQGLLTNDIVALEAGSGCYAALLTAAGRMIADMRVFELGGTTLVDVAASQAGPVRDRFDQSIFSEDAQVEDVSATMRVLGVYGPHASRVVVAALDAAGERARLDAMPLFFNHRFDTGHGSVVVVRTDDEGVDGFDLFITTGAADAMAARLRAAGAVDVDADVVEVTRIEGGRPRFGVDMDEDTIPLEAGIEDRAISLTKGCYVGQEIIIRVLHRGQGRVAKRLVGLTLDPGSTVPARGTIVRSGERAIGIVTSATLSPAAGRPIALGYVHRDFAAPSTAVSIVTNGVAEPAVVSALPFVPAAAAGVRS